MSRTTLSPGTTVANGVRVHPNGGSYEVRVRPFKPQAGFPLTEAGFDAAVAYAIKLRKRRDGGFTDAPPPDEDERTLADAARDHLAALEQTGGRNGTPYGPEGMKAARRDARPWLGQSIPPRYGKGGVRVAAPEPVDAFGRRLGATPLTELRPDAIAVYLTARHAKTPRAAVGEAQMFRAVIERELGLGRKLDPAILSGLPRLKRAETKRPPFGLAEYEYLLGHVVEHQRRVIQLGTTLGGRIMELLACEDAWLDGNLLTIPAWACKERREKELPLLAEEVKLFREAQLVRSANAQRGRLGSRLVFPRKEGGAWKHAHFYQDVIVPSRRYAARAWRAEHDLGDDAPTPFEWIVRDRHGNVVHAEDGSPKIAGFQPHDMRRSAATIMRKLGIDAELAAQRLGHKDAGYLLLTTYADTRREDLERALKRVDAAGGVRAALAAAEAQ